MTTPPPRSASSPIRVAAVTAFLVFGYALVPAAGDAAVIRACYDKTTGALRKVASFRECGKNETGISWSTGAAPVCKRECNNVLGTLKVYFVKAAGGDLVCSDEPALVVHCDPYACNTEADICLATCSKNSDCQDGYVCDLVEWGRCVPPIFRCDGDHTLVGPNNEQIECSPYRCVGNQCRQTCNSKLNCAPNYSCSADGNCLPPI